MDFERAPCVQATHMHTCMQQSLSQDSMSGFQADHSQVAETCVSLQQRDGSAHDTNTIELPHALDEIDGLPIDRDLTSESDNDIQLQDMERDTQHASGRSDIEMQAPPPSEDCFAPSNSADRSPVAPLVMNNPRQ
eukprot:6475448-Amphidinium_carterae.2